MVKKLLGVVAVAIIITGAVGLYFRFFGALTVAVTQTQKASTFDVSGTGSVTVAPDEAQVSLGVQKSAPTVAAAQNQTNQVVKDLTDKLTAMGIAVADIRTSQYSVYPSYNPQGMPSGYTVSSTTLVKIHDFTKVGPVLDLSGQLGLNQVGGLSFTLSDTLEAKTMSDARKQAIDAAEKKAQELASLSGMKLGRIVNVTEGQNNIPRPMPMMAAGIDKAATPSTPTEVSPGTTEVNVTETLSYETL